MVKYIKACDGYKFVPTDKANDRILHKYDKLHAARNQYKQVQHYVPKVWVDKGYVKEVKEVI